MFQTFDVEFVNLICKFYIMPHVTFSIFKLNTISYNEKKTTNGNELGFDILEYETVLSSASRYRFGDTKRLL